jgi:flavodoxin
MAFKVSYSFDYTKEPTPAARIKMAKQCEKNLKLNVNNYKRLDNKILYYKNVLIIDIWYDGEHKFDVPENVKLIN